MNRPFCVCVPARNEAAHIGTLIAALAGQTVAVPVPLALCVNNSDDGTSAAARAAAAQTNGQVALTLVEKRFTAIDAHAGSARRAAMDLGATMLKEADGLLLSTDADCRPPTDWIAANLAWADEDRIVGGQIMLDEDETVPGVILELRGRFDRYWEQVRAIEDLLDPQPWDPAPRHGDHTGASLALSVSLYQRAGGVPLLPTGEDRALVDAAVAAGGTLIHPAAVWTRASARTVGRAAGGMAADMQRWTQSGTAQGQVLVPSFDQWRARAEWRRQQRDRGTPIALAQAEQRLDPMPCDMPLPGPA